jgi:hypothetical protein
MQDLEKNCCNPYKKLKKDERIEDILSLEKKDTELPPIPYEEIIKKLRIYDLPITFFGETPM